MYPKRIPNWGTICGMTRPRKKERRDWPTGLTARKDARKNTYYTYRGPAASKEVYLGYDLKAAKIGVATIVAKTAKDPVQKIIAKIERPAVSLADHATWYKQSVIDDYRDKRGKPLSENTRYEAKRMVDKFVAEMGQNRGVESLDRRVCVAFLEKQTARVANQYRSRLKSFFNHARARGLREDNPIEGTLERAEVIQRERLKKETYDRIYERAEPWLQRAMDLVLYSLQRRVDLVLLKVDQNWDGEVFSVAQKKVERHGSGRLRIKPGAQLRQAILACVDSSDRGDCPFLLFAEPEKDRQWKGREHRMQLTREALTKAFREIRDTLPEMQTLDRPKRPSFGEIRPLGADLYRRSGWAVQEVQQLLGHVDEGSAMTRHYLDGHGERWSEVDMPSFGKHKQGTGSQAEIELEQEED